MHAIKRETYHKKVFFLTAKKFQSNTPPSQLLLLYVLEIQKARSMFLFTSQFLLSQLRNIRRMIKSDKIYKRQVLIAYSSLETRGWERSNVSLFLQMIWETRHAEDERLELSWKRNSQIS